MLIISSKCGILENLQVQLLSHFFKSSNLHMPLCSVYFFFFISIPTHPLGLLSLLPVLNLMQSLQIVRTCPQFKYKQFLHSVALGLGFLISRWLRTAANATRQVFK